MKSINPLMPPSNLVVSQPPHVTLLCMRRSSLLGHVCDFTVCETTHALRFGEVEAMLFEKQKQQQLGSIESIKTTTGAAEVGAAVLVLGSFHP